MPNHRRLFSSSSPGDLEQSEKLRSLHQLVELTSKSDSESSEDHHQLLRNRDCTAVNHTRENYDEIVTLESEPTVSTSLLRKNITNHRSKREYSVISSVGSRRFNAFKHNILRLQPALFSRFRSSKIETPPPIVLNGDRRNEFFSLKRLIFMMLGMPSTPAISKRMQTLSSK